MYFDQIYGLVLIATGVTGWLLARGTLPRNPGNAEAWEHWRERFGRILMVLSPLIILGGVLEALGLI